MSNKKATKRALLTSITALAMCVVMLVGTTFAWFTDTAKTSVNKIQAGNLKMEVTYKNSTTAAEFKPVNEEAKVFMENALWEPGHVEYVVLNVKNVGNLALKYKLGINIASETDSTNVLGNEFKLSDYIKFGVVEEDLSGKTREQMVAAVTDSKLINAGYSKESALKAAQDTAETLKNDETVTLVVWMPTDVGNVANHATTATAPEIKLGIDVYATQYTYESDSNGTDYDKDALYSIEITTAQELANFIDTVAANQGEYRWESLGGTKYYRATVELANDIDMSGVTWDKNLQVNEYSNIVIDGKGHSIKNLSTTGGLFGKVGISSLKSTVTVQNLTIDNATITEKDYGGSVVAAGAFAGSGGAVKYVNCEVVKSTITSSKYAGGFVGYDATGGSIPLEAINCVVENTSVTVTNSAAGASGSAGGFCGYTQSLQNYTGLDVKDGVTVRVNAERAYAGRYIGTLNAVVTLKNCVQQSMENGMLAGRTVPDKGKLDKN